MPIQATAHIATTGTTADSLPDFDSGCLSKSHVGGFRIHGYHVTEEIGRGGMGVVFRAHDPAQGRAVAIKMLTPERLVLTDARNRFAREAKASAAIQHENVVAIHAVSNIHGLPYVVMEYVGGGSLQRLIDRLGPVPVPDVARYGRQLAAALHAAHERHVVHRDIKPDNILITRDTGSIKITDFGLARCLDDPNHSLPGVVVGTPQYMAPEQYKLAKIDHRTDLFSLGGVLYALCTGMPPFAGRNVAELSRQICTGSHVPIRARRYDLPAWLVELITRLLARSPGARYQSAADVVAAFENGVK